MRAELVRRLSVPDLAFTALGELAKATVQINRHNGLDGARMGLEREPDRDLLLRSLAEAWDWLVSKALLSREPGQGGDWTFVTRRGRELAALDDGRARLLAEERLDVELHGLLERRVRRLFLQGDFGLS